MWCGRWLFSGSLGEPPLGLFVTHVHKTLIVVASRPRLACMVFFFLSGCLYAGFPLLFLFSHLFLSWKSTNLFGFDFHQQEFHFAPGAPGVSEAPGALGANRCSGCVVAYSLRPDAYPTRLGAPDAPGRQPQHPPSSLNPRLLLMSYPASFHLPELF